MTTHPFSGHGQPFDVMQPIRSESAQWMGSHGDAELCVRICRYPSAGVAWIWAHVWLAGRQLAYNVDFHQCTGDEAGVDSPGVVYATTDIGCTLRRHGPPDATRGADVVLEVPFHADAHPPNRPGDVPVRIEATFVPGALSAATRGGRQEVRGDTEASVTLPDRTIRIAGHGHWHEQLQTAPRWLVPFTYVSLRGDGVSLVATRIPAGTRGFAQRRGALLRVVAADIESRGPERKIHVELEDGSVVEGVARAVHTGSVYLYGRRRAASRVSVDDGRLVGTINDWDPEGR